MDYIRQLFYRAFWDAWDLVFDQRVLSAMIGLGIFFSTLIYLRCRNEHEDAKRRLKEFGTAALFTIGAFTLVFVGYFCFLTPKALVKESKDAAGKSNTRAQKAEDALKVVPSSPPVQRLEVTTTEKDSEARSELAKTKIELRDTQTELSQTKKQLEQLQNRQNDRVISPEDRQKLVSFLDYAPKGKVIVKADWMDGEAHQFANQITAVLKETGFSVLNVNPQVVMMTSGKGAYIFVKDFSKPPIHAVPIQQSFLAIGIKLEGATATAEMQSFAASDSPNNLESDTLIIWVTRKP